MIVRHHNFLLRLNCGYALSCSLRWFKSDYWNNCLLMSVRWRKWSTNSFNAWADISFSIFLLYFYFQTVFSWSHIYSRLLTVFKLYLTIFYVKFNSWRNIWRRRNWVLLFLILWKRLRIKSLIQKPLFLLIICFIHLIIFLIYKSHFSWRIVSWTLFTIWANNLRRQYSCLI